MEAHRTHTPKGPLGTPILVTCFWNPKTRFGRLKFRKPRASAHQSRSRSWCSPRSADGRKSEGWIKWHSPTGGCSALSGDSTVTTHTRGLRPLLPRTCMLSGVPPTIAMKLGDFGPAAHAVADGSERRRNLYRFQRAGVHPTKSEGRHLRHK